MPKSNLQSTETLLNELQNLNAQIQEGGKRRSKKAASKKSSKKGSKRVLNL